MANFILSAILWTLALYGLAEIIKTIYYDLKPITPEDAILKLQEKQGDRFITFINSETNKVNVLFKLKDNKNYGIVEPDV